MSDVSLKQKTARGLLWGGMSGGLMQLLGALFGIILLRLLTPQDYGKIAVLLIFSNIASNLQESGFIAALCNRREPTQEEYNSVFFFNIIVSTVLYVFLYKASPLIADFYHEPVLTPLARFLFLGFWISAFGTVQRAWLYGHLKVKEQSIISIVALILSNVIGVVMAWRGFAFWGLATQSVSYVLITMLLDWYVSPWRPILAGEAGQGLKGILTPAFRMFGFSCKLLITNLFNQLNSQVFSVILGRFYSTSIVGLYSNARKWNDMAMNTVGGMVTQTAQPVMAQVVEDQSRSQQVFRKMLRFVSFVSFPAMLGLGLIAREFILIAVGDQWEASASLLSLICIYGAFYPLSMLYSYLTISHGRSGVNMFCTITLCVLVWIVLFAAHPYGLRAMVIGFVVLNILWLGVWQYFAWRLIRLSLWHALMDILPFLALASGVMALTWWLTSGIENIYLLVIAKILIAATLYCGLTYLSGAKIMREAIAFILKK